MALMAQQGASLVTDGDSAFYRVDTRTPAHELPSGVAADATNKRFEDGRAWPRLAVVQEAWGKTQAMAPGCAVRGYKRLNDPNGFDVTVVVTDDWRNNAGEDGGRGRAWKIQAGNGPQQIPLNGHDIYGPACLAPCYNGLALLRDGNERHYFPAANIAPGGNAGQVKLNCQPAWNDGDAALFVPDASTGSSLAGGTKSPAPNTLVYVKSAGGNAVKLFKTSDVTSVNAVPFDFTGGTGRFYLERQAVNPGYFGNGSPALLAQPDVLGNTLFDAGFLAAPAKVQVTAVTNLGTVITAPNHRLVPGDLITYYDASTTPPTNTNYYANPANANQITIYPATATGQAAALAASAGNGTGGQATQTWTAGNYIMKVGASGMPMPPARYGFYTENNRLVLVNGKNNIIISDPLDPLHYTPLSDELTANLGESDGVTALAEISSSDTLIILKQNSVLALYNFSGGPSQWALRSVTREYGCVAPDSVAQSGSNLYFMSRRGLDRVVYTAFGVISGTEKPVSFAVQKYIARVDWNNAALATAATWNNRLFFSYPLDGQAGSGLAVNNQTLALNFLNSEPGKDEWGWEGGWNGPALLVFGWARHIINGEERLTFCDYNGNVNWLGDGWQDVTANGTAPVADSLTTRIYTGGVPGRKMFQKALLNWDTNNPLLTVTAVCPGYNERTALTPAGGLGYDRTKYQAGFAADYVPGTSQFNAPRRADYSFAGLADALGNPADALQNTSEPFRLRQDTWGVQLVITNAQGRCLLGSVAVEGWRGLSSDRRRV